MVSIYILLRVCTSFLLHFSVGQSISCCPNRHYNCLESQCVQCTDVAQGEDTATCLRQKGHCQNNYFSSCICPVLVLHSCMHLDIIKYSYIYVGCKVHLAVYLAVFHVESMYLTRRKITSNRVSHSLIEYGIFSMLESTLQSCISVLERNLSLFTYMSSGNRTVTAVSAAI